MRLLKSYFIIILVVGAFFAPQLAMGVSKPSPDKAIELLMEGNKRFVEGQSLHPHTNADRLYQAGTENQGDHAYATVITCSDSRVPVERVFDAGVMDTFVIRVAGNVCDTDEVGSIEYGLSHVHTPVLVVLGHTQCGAVTAVTHAMHGQGHALECNIPPLVDNIKPAVERATRQNPNIHGDAIIPYAIAENVWQGVEDLFMKSPSTRDLVKNGKAKVVGAIYDVGTGKVDWLSEHPVAQILKRVDANPNRAINAMAVSAEGHGAAHGVHGSDASHSAGNIQDKAAVEKIIGEIEDNHKDAEYTEKDISAEGHGSLFLYLFGFLVLLVSAAVTFYYARVKDERGNARLQKSLGFKLIGSYSLLALILTGLSILSLSSMSRIGDQVLELSEDVIPVTNAVTQIETHQLEQAIALERIFRFGEEKGAHAKEAFEKNVEIFEDFAQKVDNEFNKGVKFLQDTPAYDEKDAEVMNEYIKRLAELKNEHTDFDMLAEKAIELIKSGKINQARLLEEHVEKSEDELNHAIEALLADLNKRSKEASHMAETDEQRAAKIISIIAFLAIIGAFTMAILNTRAIMKPINRIIMGLSDGSQQVASAAGQVSSASQQMAEGGSEQAASIEETSSSLEEISSMTKQNAEHANQADNLMKEAKQVVGLANESMGELTISMEDISKASEDTSKIIKTIDEIAFQTNLLALNAAVEAARAGDAGAGFAVVADEVRNLAMRAAEAAKNTANLIDGTVKKVKDGSVLVTKTNDAFTQVAGSTSKVGELVGEISAASNEQADGIDQVNRAVADMDKVVQQNAGNAEENASASEEMSAQAEQMKEYVGELVALVNGSADGKGSNRIGSSLKGKNQKANIHQGIFGKAKKAQNEMGSPRKKEVPPSKLIPLTDDEDFKDF